MNSRTNHVSLTPTVGRQTQQQDFGQVLKNTAQGAASLVGSALQSVAGSSPIVSAALSAVNSVTGLSSISASANTGGTTAVSRASTATVSMPQAGSIAPTGMSSVSVDGANLGEMGGYLKQMRAEADRSTLIQMQMQNESRDYNTITNVLKVRHDSAKAAINNIR